MSTFANAVMNQEARTENGMKARKSTANAVVDLFYKIGSMRGQDITAPFTAAFVQNKDLALRIAAWVRDIRGGSGERETFRNILRLLDQTDPEACFALMNKVPELGRWDDLLVITNKELRDHAFAMIKRALTDGNGLCAKWMPRKGPVAIELRNAFGWTPKFYRKRLVELTNVVETAMCSGKWDGINFSHVPSVASSRYKKAFNRHTPKYGEYVAALVKGEDKTVKVNANAIFPHDAIKGRLNTYNMKFDATELALIEAQWNALPNYVGDKNIMPIVDVSGSMYCPAGKNQNLQCIDVAVSLGLYLADKNKGKFHGTFLTFSDRPNLVTLRGNINNKLSQLVRADWGGSTNLHASLDKILDVAVKGKVDQSEMPEMLLVLSDMQFNFCVRYDDSAMEMIERKYAAAGYEVPKIVFWNLNSHDNVPVKADKTGVALVSGFSPSILPALLSGNTEQFTPEGIMLETIMKDRYAVL